MGAKNSGSGIELRKGVRTESIRIVFWYEGKRCREQLSLAHTKNNIAYARRLQGEVVNAIERGTFNYEEFFPDSRTAQRLIAARSELVLPSTQSVTTVGSLVRDALAIAKKTLEHSSYNCYRQIAETHLFPKWDLTPASDLSSRDLRHWIMGLTGKRKTIQLILTPLRNAMALGVADNVLKEDPFDSIKLGKLLSKEQRTSDFTADPFNIDEIEAILGACVCEEERNMFQCAFTTGLRPSEYIALRWPNADEMSYLLAVTRAFVDGQEKQRAKTEAGIRKVDIRVGALAALQSQRKYTGQNNGLVFLNPRTREQWAGDKPIYRRWKRILKNAGVRFRNPYQTRHTFASTLLMLGAVPLYVASQLGHTDTTMVTKTYGKWIKAGLDGGRRQRLLMLYMRADSKCNEEFPKLA